MANEKFTQLPTVTNATLADIIAAVQGGVSVQETLGQVFTLMLANVILNNAGNPNGSVAGVVYQLCWDTTDNLLYVCTTTGSTSTAVWTLSTTGSFPVTMAHGGTGASLTAANGAIPYSTASAIALLAPTATALQMFQSGANSAPSWSSSVWPASTVANQLLYSSSTNTVAGLAAVDSSVLATSAAGVPTWLGPMTNGQLIIGSTGAIPVAATLSAGANIGIVNAAGSITISATGLGGFSWNVVTGTSQNMVSNNGYMANNSSLVTLNLPATSAVGDEIDVLGVGAGGWLVQCGSGQNIIFGDVSTSSAGSLASTNQSDSFYMVCTVANTTWQIGSSPQGTLTVV